VNEENLGRYPSSVSTVPVALEELCRESVLSNAPTPGTILAASFSCQAVSRSLFCISPQKMLRKAIGKPRNGKEAFESSPEYSSSD
jgi:hypothetical protein